MANRINPERQHCKISSNSEAAITIHCASLHVCLCRDQSLRSNLPYLMCVCVEIKAYHTQLTSTPNLPYLMCVCVEIKAYHSQLANTKPVSSHVCLYDDQSLLFIASLHQACHIPCVFVQRSKPTIPSWPTPSMSHFMFICAEIKAYHSQLAYTKPVSSHVSTWRSKPISFLASLHQACLISCVSVQRSKTTIDSQPTPSLSHLKCVCAEIKAYHS